MNDQLGDLSEPGLKPKYTFVTRSDNRYWWISYRTDAVSGEPVVDDLIMVKVEDFWPQLIDPGKLNEPVQ
jgi:hypothetical protein